MTLISNHSSLGLRFGVAALAACLCSIGQAYNFVNWTYPNSTTASGSVGSLGTAVVSTTASNTTLSSYGLQFNSVPFTPTATNGIGVSQTSVQAWGFTINLSGLTNTNGVIVGLGNFGHGTGYPGYWLQAYDLANNPMSLAGFSVIGSYDHDWTSPSTAQFNDDLALNLVTGAFTVTTVAGDNDQNSDILFFQLPTGVSRLDVFTRLESHGDTVNVVMATRDAVPEPFTMSLLAAGVGVAIRKRRARQNR